MEKISQNIPRNILYIKEITLSPFIIGMNNTISNVKYAKILYILFILGFLSTFNMTTIDKIINMTANINATTLISS